MLLDEPTGQTSEALRTFSILLVVTVAPGCLLPSVEMMNRTGQETTKQRNGVSENDERVKRCRWTATMLTVLEALSGFMLSPIGRDRHQPLYALKHSGHSARQAASSDSLCRLVFGSIVAFHRHLLPCHIHHLDKGRKATRGKGDDKKD